MFFGIIKNNKLLKQILHCSVLCHGVAMTNKQVKSKNKLDIFFVSFQQVHNEQPTTTLF
jgi:hypothetical protein